MPPSMTPRLARRKTINALPNLFAVPIIFGHVFLSPYTKVEESFTLHAIYDVLAHPFTRAGLAKWDHLTFPGAVPRSFLPPIIIGLLSYAFTGLGVWLGWITSKVQVQLVVRAVLAALHCAVFAHLGKTIRARYGPTTRAWFMVLSLTQFHIPYYAARTLPNFLALDFVILSISLLLRVSLSIPAKVQVARIRKTVILLTATATILRLELALFLLPIVLSLVIQRKVSFMSALAYGVIGGLGSLAISAPVDYTLWLPTLSHPDFPFNSPWQLLWPEASALHYNIFQGNSAEWGVSPWYYYLVNAIPKISLASFPLALLGIAIWLSGKVVGGKVLSRFGLAKFNRSKEGQGIGEVLRLFGPGIVTLVAAMSCVGHKEWRFVIYIVPVLNVLAALAATTLWIHPFPRLRALFRLGLIGLIGLNLTFTAFSTFVSSYNYPGGEVWKVLDELYEHDVASIQAKAVPSVWLGNLAVQTGSSLFTFVHQPVPSPHSRFDLPPPAFPVRQSGSDWRYLKGQEEVMEDPEQAYRTNVDYIVTEDSAPFESWHDAQGGGWEVVAGIDGYGGIQRTGKLGLGIRWERKLAVVARK